MRSTVQWLWRGALGLSVAVALSFGATQAFAGGQPDCPPPSEGFIGTCPPFTEEMCNIKCELLFGEDSSGHCFGGECCICFI